ncbi:MAG: murein L,D-transpeptidase catalytic domain family protein, partial [Bdellovibrionota bacterium]
VKRKTINLKTSFLGLSLLALSACGQTGSQLEEACTSSGCSEKTINAPVNPVDSANPTVPSAPTSPSSPDHPLAYRFPEFQESWKLGRSTYEKAVSYYNQNQGLIKNNRYVTIIDFSQPSSHHRLYLFDLKTGSVEMHATAHGKNSDPDNDGFPTQFSNTENSLESSLGFYLTLATYNGTHGYSLRLRGLEASNNNAEARDIVMHPADYVSDAKNYAGRSWGCPAIDPSISKSVIDKVRDGSLLFIDYDPNEVRRH